MAKAKMTAKTTAGYSGTPLPQKLGIKERHQVAVVDAPAGFEKYRPESVGFDDFSRP